MINKNKTPDTDLKKELKKEWKADGRECFIIDDAYKLGKLSAQKETSEKVQKLKEIILDKNIEYKDFIIEDIDEIFKEAEGEKT